MGDLAEGRDPSEFAVHTGADNDAITAPHSNGCPHEQEVMTARERHFGANGVHEFAARVAFAGQGKVISG